MGVKYRHRVHPLSQLPFLVDAAVSIAGVRSTEDDAEATSVLISPRCGLSDSRSYRLQLCSRDKGMNDTVYAGISYMLVGF